MDKILTSMDIKDPGLRTLPPGVERYLVKGGGLSVITLDPDDKIEITDTEGRQKCEIIVFNKEGKPDCSLLGLKEKKLDKDRFRKDLGNIIQGYQEVARRLGIIHEENNISEVKFGKPKAVNIKKN